MFSNFYDIPFYPADHDAVIDRTAIKDLLEYERYCRDNGHFERMSECYSDDAIIRVSWFDGPAKEYIRQTQAAGGDNQSKHKINSTNVWLNGDKAVAEMTVTMLSPRQDIDGYDFDLVCYARILSRLCKESGLWKISYGDCIYERDSLIPVLPCASLEMSAGEINQYRESYKCLSYVLSRTSNIPDQNQPGEDKPETVAKLYREASDWLLG